MIFLLILGFAALIPFDGPRLIKEKSWRELVIYIIIMALAFAVPLLRILDVKIPNPVRETQYTVKWIFEQLHLTYD